MTIAILDMCSSLSVWEQHHETTHTIDMEDSEPSIIAIKHTIFPNNNDVYKTL